MCVCTFRSNGAVAGQLSQSQSMYTGLVPSSIAFFDIANPSSNPQNLAVTITATQGNLSWVRCAAPLHIEALLSLTLHDDDDDDDAPASIGVIPSADVPSLHAVWNP